MNRRYLLFRLVVIAYCFTLIACSSSNKISDKLPHSTNSDAAILNLNSINSLSAVSSKLAQSKVVLIGETHTNYSHHLNQLAVIKGVHKYLGKRISIGLEMVQQPFQSVLDEYVAGKISEKEMLKGVKWYERWKYDFRLYRPIFTYAKKHQIPLVALNIPTEVTKAVSKNGINSLDKSKRKYLPSFIDRNNQNYRKRLKKIYALHSHGKHSENSKGFENFVDAQLAWDEGMAFSASKYLKKFSDKQMIILAGRGHLINREGIPKRIDRLLGIRSVVVLNQLNGIPTSQNADYLLFSKEQKLPPAGIMGISMRQFDEFVQVSSILPNSAAKSAGLRKGDLILSVNNELIKRLGDISLLLLDKKVGESLVLKIQRKQSILYKTLVLKGNERSSQKTYLYLKNK